MTNSADSDQLASAEANWSGSTLFAKTGYVVFSKRKINYQGIAGEIANMPFDSGLYCLLGLLGPISNDTGKIN